MIIIHIVYIFGHIAQPYLDYILYTMYSLIYAKKLNQDKLAGANGPPAEWLTKPDDYISQCVGFLSKKNELTIL